MQGAEPQTSHVGGATEARNSMIPFQSEPRRADSRRHHSRDLAGVVSLMTTALVRVAELMTLPPGESSATGRRDVDLRSPAIM
jgi:hypothetical protein